MKHAAQVLMRSDLRPTDPAAVRRLATETGFFRPHEVDVAVELVEARLSAGPASGYEFVLADDERGRLIGFTCYGPIACTVARYDLYWIAVARACQGQGVGRLLLSETERRVAALGGRKIYIETSARPLYLPTRRFYERCGYRAEATLADFYDEGDGKVIYVMDVEQPG